MAYQHRDAVIVAAVRTPVGEGQSQCALHGVLPADLLAHSLRELVQRTGVDPAQIDDVIAGAVTQSATRPSTSREVRCWGQVFRSRFRARPSNVNVAAASRRSASPPRASSPALRTSSAPRASNR